MAEDHQEVGHDPCDILATGYLPIPEFLRTRGEHNWFILSSNQWHSYGRYLMGHEADLIDPMSELTAPRP